MNAETRAKEIIDKLCFCDSELRRLIGDYGIDLIAKAITRAENDKLEEARLIASAKIPNDVPGDEYERGRNNAACEISIEIERLKTPKD